MIINAKEKIIEKVNELLPMDSTIPCEHYRDERAVELFYKFLYYSNIKKLLRQYKRQYLEYAIDSYKYPNGLIRLESYCVLNGEYVINQTVITDSLETNNVIVHVWNKYELKSLQQFFIKSESPSLLFGFPCSSNEERNIETNETEIEIENKVIGRFSKIGKNNSKTVYAEKYMPINRISYWELMPKDIFSNIELEILYRYNDEPVFAQLSNDKGDNLLEGRAYHTADYKDSEIFVNSVNYEVDAILKKITALITKYDKSAKEKNSDENNWIKDINKVASRLTREKSMELITNREEYIQQQMQKIAEEEYQSEVLIMLEDENYDDEDFNMILGSGYPTNLPNKSDNQNKKLVKKKYDIVSKKHVNK